MLVEQKLLWQQICFLLGPEDTKEKTPNKKERVFQKARLMKVMKVSFRSPPTHSELTANSRCVLDLPHALGEAFEEGAPAVLPLVANVRNDVVWGEVASAQEAAMGR